MIKHIFAEAIHSHKFLIMYRCCWWCWFMKYYWSTSPHLRLPLKKTFCWGIYIYFQVVLLVCEIEWQTDLKGKCLPSDGSAHNKCATLPTVTQQHMIGLSPSILVNGLLLWMNGDAITQFLFITKCAFTQLPISSLSKYWAINFILLPSRL